jgi:RHS repeat-associated protein
VYDLRGLRTTLYSQDTGLVTDVYDDMGNRIKHIDAVHDANGTEVQYVYDRDRLSEIEYPSKAPVTYKYENARLSEVTDETGAQSFEYGALGEKRRVLRTIARLDGTKVTFDTHFTTDSLGRQLQVVYPDGTTISNTYDDGGALAQVTGSGSGWSKVYADEIQYDVFGNRTHMRFGNNVETTWTYEPQRVRLSTVTTTLPSGPNVQQLVYGYDPASNPLTINNNVPALTGTSGMRPGPSTLTLTYDGVDQLTKVQGSGWVDASNDTTYDETFEYSASHNISHKARNHNIASQQQDATSFDSTYKYQSGHPHLPSTIDALTITYDLSGNPTERDNGATGVQQTLTWDDDNRLSTITTSTYVQTNTYDAFGTRALRDENGDQTLFANQYFDLAGTNGGEEYVFAGDMRVATVLGGFTSGENPAPPTTPGTPYYLHPDYLGSTAVVTTDAGDAQESHDYFVDGEAWVDHTSATPVNGYLFEGKPYDKLTGFYDYGQRFYDPRTSLWLGEDPAFTGSPGKAVGRPTMLAVSAFSAQSPGRFIDPDGREPAGLSGFDLGGAAPSFPDPFARASHHAMQIAQDPNTYKEVAFTIAAAVVPYGDAVNRARKGDYKGAVASAAIQTVFLGIHLIGAEAPPGASPYEDGFEPPQLPSAPDTFAPDPWDGPRYWRGSRGGQAPDFTPGPNEYRVDPNTGTVKPTHGVSVFDNPESVSAKGFQPHEVDQSTIPDTLQIKQRGTDPHHYEIMPKEGTKLTPLEFTTACQSILCK